MITGKCSVQCKIQTQLRIIEDEELGGYKWMVGFYILKQRTFREYGSDYEQLGRTEGFLNYFIRRSETNDNRKMLCSMRCTGTIENN